MAVENSTPSDSKWNAAAAPEEIAVAPVVSSRRKSALMTRGNLLLGGLFALGILGIWLLHFRTGPAQASAAVLANESRMDTFLQTLNQIRASSKDAASDGAAVVHTFYYESRQRQVPIAQLRANPFCFVLPAPPPPQAPALSPQAPASAPAGPDDDAAAFTQAMKAAGELTLQSVLTGSAGATAMISNNLLTVGQKIAGWTVLDIQPRQVLLEWKGHRQTLTMK
jgi:hypothetical protein